MQPSCEFIQGLANLEYGRSKKIPSKTLSNSRRSSTPMNCLNATFWIIKSRKVNIVTPLTTVNQSRMQTDRMSHLHQRPAIFTPFTNIISFNWIYFFFQILHLHLTWYLTELNSIKIICWTVNRAAIVNLIQFSKNPAERLLNFLFSYLWWLQQRYCLNYSFLPV